MKNVLSLCLLLLVAGSAWAIDSIAILPFSNESEKQEIYWLGEGFAESLTEELLLKNLYVIQRPARKAAYEQLHLPYSNNLSRATMLKIGNKLSADLLVFGSYTLKKNILEVDARVIDLPSARLSSPIKASGALDKLYDVQVKLRDGLKQHLVARKYSTLEGAHVQNQNVPLHAYEAYIKGLLEGSDLEKVKFFERALEAFPEYQQATYRLGLTLNRVQKYRESNEVLKKASFTGILKTKAEFLTALNWYLQGNLQTALGIWQPMMQKQPTPELYNNIAIVQQRLNKPDEALWYFSKAVQMNQQHNDYQFNAGLCYFMRSQNDPAVYHFREAVRLRAGDYQALYYLSRIIEKNNAAPARLIRASFQETIPTDQKGKFPEQYATSPQLLFRPSRDILTGEERQYEKEAAEKNRKEMSTYAETYKTNARRYLEENRPDKAIIELRKGISLARLDWYLHYLHGFGLQKQGKTADAELHLLFSVWCLDNADSHVLLADIYREAGRYEDAKRHVQLTLALDPKNKRAMEIWSKIYNKVAKG